MAYDGHITGDLAKGERWAEATRYPIRNLDEPFVMAEITEAYRDRHKPSRHRLPLALTVRNAYVRSKKTTFADGSVVLGEAEPLLAETPDELIDFIYDDPPYGLWQGQSLSHHIVTGKTLHHWDTALDWDSLWPLLWKVLAARGTIAISAAEPLASVLVASQVTNFLYCWYWRHRATSIYNPSHKRPMITIEPIPVFSRVGHQERTYDPQMRPMNEVVERIRGRNKLLGEVLYKSASPRVTYHAMQPIDLIEAPWTKYDRFNGSPYMHAQKPVELARYLLRTHTRPGDLVLDPTAGSMTTPVACILEGRKFLAFEKDRTHYALGVKRLQRLYAELGAS